MILSTHGIVGSQIQSFVGLLDLYPSAAVAYSVRKLSSTYTGSAIRVRRSSDNTEQDIGFTALGNLDTTALTTFCSGTNGFVTTWYDQSGNGINATQTTAANQPQIVSSGSVITVNSKPAIFSNDKSIANTALSLSVPITDFFNYKINVNTGAGYQCLYDGAGPENRRGFFGLQNSNIKDVIYDGLVLDGYTSTLNQTLATNLRNGSNSKIYKNNSLISSGSSGVYSPIIGIRFGKDNGDATGSNVYYQEFIRYSGSSSNISGINTNINTYYAIY
jgi:3D (Asp-Asp-Asp) domain-containing protein